MNCRDVRSVSDATLLSHPAPCLPPPKSCQWTICVKKWSNLSGLPLARRDDLLTLLAPECWSLVICGYVSLISLVPGPVGVSSFPCDCRSVCFTQHPMDRPSGLLTLVLAPDHHFGFVVSVGSMFGFPVIIQWDFCEFREAGGSGLVWSITMLKAKLHPGSSNPLILNISYIVGKNKHFQMPSLLLIANIFLSHHIVLAIVHMILKFNASYIRFDVWFI